MQGHVLVFCWRTAQSEWKHPGILNHNPLQVYTTSHLSIQEFYFILASYLLQRNIPVVLMNLHSVRDKVDCVQWLNILYLKGKEAV